MKKNSINEELPCFYQQLSEQGVRFYVNDRPAKPKKVFKKLVEEENVYMADYVLGDDGKITEVRVDRIHYL